MGDGSLGRYLQGQYVPVIVAVGHTGTYGRPNGQIHQKHMQNQGTPSTHEHAQTCPCYTRGPLSLLLLVALMLLLVLLFLWLFLLQPNTKVSRKYVQHRGTPSTQTSLLQGPLSLLLLLRLFADENLAIPTRPTHHAPASYMDFQDPAALGFGTLPFSLC